MGQHHIVKSFVQLVTEHYEIEAESLGAALTKVMDGEADPVEITREEPPEETVEIAWVG